jgi:YidC/Oxa1 family membrane protein insertase
MDRNRLILFIVISVVITVGFQYLLPGRPVHHAAITQAAPDAGTNTATQGSPNPSPLAPPGHQPAPVAPPANAPRVVIDAPRVKGSISLVGARLDDIQLRDYHDTVAKSSPLVRVLEPAADPQPSYIQFGWAAAPGVKVPDDTTIWTSGGGDLTQDHPVTLSWDNGAGLRFRIDLAVDANYMFHATQSVTNTGKDTVDLYPWQRARRDYVQPPASYGVLFEGVMGVADNHTHQLGYPAMRTDAEKAGGWAYEHSGGGGWSGFTDKYWLTALIPDQQTSDNARWFYAHDDGTDHYQVSYQTTAPEHLAPGGQASADSRLFVGAKEVHLLDRYEVQDHIPLLSYAVDWGRFFFLTKPFFYCIDWLYSITGNFGIAILIFTVIVKTLFFPLVARSYQSMGKMRLLAPKIQAARERHKDDPAKQQAAMMEVYKQEGISPLAQAGGCLPMLIQIPVFFSLYKVILVTIEMRHAPFFGWVHDLSATDPTNVFNLFGLIPFDPGVISPMLHLGLWPLILGVTMFLQQKLNPPPPDPVQARMFQFMPILFTFMMGRFPAGLVIYWTWNNLLTIVQQWTIQRRAKLSGPAKA